MQYKFMKFGMIFTREKIKPFTKWCTNEKLLLIVDVNYRYVDVDESSIIAVELRCQPPFST